MESEVRSGLAYFDFAPRYYRYAASMIGIFNSITACGIK